MDSSTLLWVLGGVLMLVGLAGTLLPVLPGIPLMLIGMLLAAWADDFTRIGWVTLVILGVLMALSFVIEIAAAALGAKRVGASRAAITGAALGAVLGMLLGPVGLIIGPFVGAFIGELMSRPDGARAMRVGVAAWIGYVIGTVAKVAVAFSMLGIFIAAWIID